ncbi:MAG: IS3 family transposase [Nitrospira sp.]|nr:IS3 family transposase [Nitrospira sp.]MDF0643986.1 IS3 family transposase [Nitrospira sp.]MDF0643995.1 IS3 family transposase [Nitrospira sp.]
MRYRFIQAHRTEYRLTGLCRTLGVSRSGYYAWRQRPASARATANARLLEQIQELHRQTKARYGAVKVWRALRLAGVRCGRHRVARLRRQHGLLAQRIRRFRMTIERHEFAPPAPNRLRQVFVAPASNRIWAGDLTAIATRAGWLYLAVILDLYSRRVIGWAMSAKPDQHVALQAMHMALAQRCPPPGLIHHSDQGALYTSVAYQRLLAQRGVIASMSRKGNCFDNAVVESFFSTLKNELVHEQRFHTREDAQAAVFEFIEVFYNRRRLHQTLGYVSPMQFEARRLP